jgi:molybdate transport system substrate-binding protein
VKPFVGAVIVGSLVAAGGCGPRPESTNTIRVAAAADLRYALEDLIARFKTEHPDLDVTAAYGSSGTFFSQLQNGAPFDVFLSADVEYPRRLDAAGLTLPESTFTYAVGRLVLWTRKASSVAVKRGFDVLLDPAVGHLAIANPEHAPYGRAAEAALSRAGVLTAVHSKLVLGENVSQTLQFVQSGSADVGIVALSLALAPTVADAGTYWPVPLDLYPRMEQGGTIMKSAANVEAARRFTAFMQAAEGREILRRYGFSEGGS